MDDIKLNPLFKITDEMWNCDLPVSVLSSDEYHIKYNEAMVNKAKEISPQEIIAYVIYDCTQCSYDYLHETLLIIAISKI